MTKMNWPAKPAEADFYKASLGIGLARPWTGPEEQKRKNHDLVQQKRGREFRSEDHDKEQATMQLIQDIWDKQYTGIPLGLVETRILRNFNRSKKTP